MNTNTQRTAPRWARSARIGPKPGPLAASRAQATARLTVLKNHLARRHLAAAPAAVVPAVGRAANDAASLAWATAYPLLVFPLLLEERVAGAHGQAARQERIHRRGAAWWEPAT